MVSRIPIRKRILKAGRGEEGEDWEDCFVVPPRNDAGVPSDDVGVPSDDGDASCNDAKLEFLKKAYKGILK